MPYTPSKLPKLTDPDAIALAQYFEDELQSLSRGLVENITELDLSPIFAAPKKPRQGMVVYADGTLWNPGSGEGLYVYSSGGTWIWLEDNPVIPAAKSFSIVKQLFSSSGTYTPTAGMVYCIIEAVGPGGGSGGTTGNATFYLSAGGGGGGSYSRKVASAAAIGASQIVTVGTGGAAGASGSNSGSAGSGPTSVGTLCIANAGNGGLFCSTTQFGNGGGGGVVGTGDLTIKGGDGGSGFFLSGGATIYTSGRGGNSFFGNGATGVASGGGTAAGLAGNLYGSGASGAVSGYVAVNAAGARGADGCVFITEYIYA